MASNLCRRGIHFKFSVLLYIYCTAVAGNCQLTRIAVKVEEGGSGMKKEEESESFEPLTPVGCLFNQPSLNCYILVIIGLKKKIDVELFKAGLESTLVQHKRFSSIVKEDKRGNLNWVPTKVNIDCHIVCPRIESAEPEFVENYTAKLATAKPLDPSKPLWEMHFLNVKSEEAASSAVLRVHHSLGDGVSLMSLLLSCARQVANPRALPAVPCHVKSNGRDGYWMTWALAVLWKFLLSIWYTFFAVMHFFATAIWLKDSDTPIKGYPGVESSPKRLVHVTLSLADIKNVKNAVNATVNDVFLAMISAGLVRYLDRRYEEGSDQKPCTGKKLLVRALVPMNTRPSPGLHELANMSMKVGTKARWGNNVGLAIVPLPMVKHDDPLDYVRAATLISKRKKLSLEALFTYAIGMKLQMKIRGIKATTSLLYKMVSKTTFGLSNMVGPMEEVQLFGHPVAHIVPTVFGHPQSLTIHFQSYMGTVKLVMTAAESVIPDPKQLCWDCVDALHQMCVDDPSMIGHLLP
eukprot:Gb_16734 [translate_table: standard]